MQREIIWYEASSPAVLGFDASDFHRIEEPCRNDSTSALNIVIEAQLLVSVLSQQVKAMIVGKIFELEESSWPFVLDRTHELIDQRVKLGIRKTWVALTEIELIFEKSLSDREWRWGKA